jgi:hypothetical protein
VVLIRSFRSLLKLIFNHQLWSTFFGGKVKLTPQNLGHTNSLLCASCPSNLAKGRQYRQAAQKYFTQRMAVLPACDPQKSPVVQARDVITRQLKTRAIGAAKREFMEPMFNEARSG